MQTQPAATRLLAAFVAAWRWEDVPTPVRREGVRSLLNFVGGALGSCHDEAVSLAATVLAPYFGAAQASVIGRSERSDDIVGAVLILASDESRWVTGSTLTVDGGANTI